MVAKRATPICVRCRINPTDTVSHTCCPPCWDEVLRARGLILSVSWSLDPQ